MQDTSYNGNGSNSVSVEDILGIDDILGIRAEDNIPSVESFMDEIFDEPDEEKINSMPVETIQKNPDKIEELTVPHTIGTLEDVREERQPGVSFGIEELNTNEEIAKKLAPKPAPVPAPAPAPAPAKPEPKPEPQKEEVSVPAAEPAREAAEAENETAGADMSLEDFEAAVKKLKSMLDNGLISESEFAVEKKKLFKLLY